MKILAIDGSPRKKGNTNFVIETLSSLLSNKDIFLDHMILSDKKIEYCSGCLECEIDGNENQCIIDDDMTNSISDQLFNYDILIFCTPTYFDMPTAQMKCFMDRCNMILDKILKKKFLFSAIIVGQTEKTSLENNFSSLNKFCAICEMDLICNPLYLVARDVNDARNNAKALVDIKQYASDLVLNLR